MRFKNQLGISLIEVLLAMGLGLLILSGIIDLFILNRSTFVYVQAFSELQENGRIISDFLQSEIRMAGFIGCAKFSKEFPIDDQRIRPSFSLTSETMLRGFNGNNIIQLPGLDNTSLVADSDIVMLQKMSTEVAYLQDGIKSSDQFLVSLPFRFKKGRDVIVADCKHASVFSVISATKLRGRNIQVLKFSGVGHNYSYDTEVGYLERAIFYIADTGRTNVRLQPIHSLYMEDESGRKHELFEGVEKMVIEYGVFNSKEQVLQYHSTTTVRDWSAVRTLKITLLLVSKEPALTRAESYLFQGKKHVSTDNRLRRQWNVFVSLRNR